LFSSFTPPYSQKGSSVVGESQQDLEWKICDPYRALLKTTSTPVNILQESEMIPNLCYLLPSTTTKPISQVLALQITLKMVFMPPVVSLLKKELL
jgi:hypothetical protein